MINFEFVSSMDYIESDNNELCISCDDNEVDDQSIIAKKGTLYVETRGSQHDHMNEAGVCLICGQEGNKLSKCKDVKSWDTLSQFAEAKQHAGILSLLYGKGDFPKTSVVYHRDRRSDFTRKRESLNDSLP